MKKMIKQFRILFPCLLLAAGFYSCQSLDENAEGVLVASTFFETTADLDAAVMAAYKAIADDTWGGYASRNVWNPLEGGDDLCSPNGSSAYDRFNVTDLNGVMHWGRSYIIVREASNVINNYERVTGDANYILEKAAEAHFIRAWAYFWLVRLYGEIPKVTSIEIDYNLPLSPVSEIYAFIVEDLNFAIKYLPKTRGKYDGHPSIWSARALLGQVYLTMAGWPLKDESKYALAAQEAKAVIESNEYKLMEDFRDLWFDATGDNCAEVVWSVQFCSFPDCGVWQRSTFIGLNVMPSEEQGWGGGMAEVGFYKRFPDNYRKEQTFHTVFERRSSVGGPIVEYIPFENSVQQHPYYKKFRRGYVQGEPEYNGDSDHMGGRDFNYLRYAEVLLMYAEAQCMAEGGPNAMAYDCINQVRKRATKGVDDPLTPGLGQIAFRDKVIEERGWEFAQEYCRWFDLVRTEKVEEMMALKDPVDYPPLNPITKERYLVPIPYTDKLLNPNLDKSK